MKSRISYVLILVSALNLNLITSCGLFKRVDKTKSSLELDSASNLTYQKGMVDTGSTWTYRRITPFAAPALNLAGSSGSAINQEDLMRFITAITSAQSNNQPLVLPGTYYIPGLYEEWTNEKKGFSLNLDSSASTLVKKEEDRLELEKAPDASELKEVLFILLAIIVTLIFLVIIVERVLKRSQASKVL